MKRNLSAIFAIAIFFISIGIKQANAQFTGYTVELDTIFFGANTPTPEDTFDPEGLLEFYGAYRVYANFTNQNDVLSAIYSDVVALGTPPMFISAPCGCHNPVTTSMAMDASNSSLFWPTFPEYEYDTYWTIGMESADDSGGTLPSTIGLLNGATICSASTDNGSVFTAGTPSNTIAGADLRVLIAQITTCGDWSLQACIQTFVSGDQSNIQQSCPDLLEIAHIYNDGECVNDADGDGICDEMEVAGCLEEGACNYEPDATDDSMDCDYSCFGCTDVLACNFAELATIDDFSCEFLSCAGCMISYACNYDFEATIGDNSCILPGDPCDDGDPNSVNDFIQDIDCSCLGYGCHDTEACNYAPDAINDPTVCNYISLYSITGEIQPTANMLLSYSYPNTTGSTYDWVSTSGDVTDGEGTSDVAVSWWGSGAGTLCVTETNSGGCSGDQVCLSVNITPVSVSEIENSAIEVFPTPASTELFINLSKWSSEEANLTLRDASGRMVWAMKAINQTTIDMSSLPRGSYILQIDVQGLTPTHKRVILN
jgi:hypothetical protein